MCVWASWKHLLICLWPFAGLWSPDCVSLFWLHLFEHQPHNHACKYTALKKKGSCHFHQGTDKVHLKSLWLPLSWAISARTIPIRLKNSQLQSLKLDYINNINKTANWMCGLRGGGGGGMSWNPFEGIRLCPRLLFLFSLLTHWKWRLMTK